MEPNFSPESFASFLAGDTSFLDQIYKFYNDRLYTVAFRLLRRRDEAEDIVIETITKLWYKRDTLTDPTKIEGFLFVTLRNGCLDKIRKYKRKNWIRPIEYTEQFADELTDPASLYIQDGIEADVISILLREISQELKNLPPQCQKVFDLYKIQGKSMEEIAQLLKIRPKTAYSHWLVAKNKFNKVLKEKGLRFLLVLFFHSHLFF